MAIKVCGQPAASARQSSGVAAKASPIGSPFASYGSYSAPPSGLLEEKEDIQERIRNGLHGQESAIADDAHFGHLGDAMKSVLELGAMAPQPPRTCMRRRSAIRQCRCCTLACISHDKRAPASPTCMQTVLSSCVGAASTLHDQAQASAMVEHDKMIGSLVNITTAVGDYRKSMGPQNHERDGLVADCEKLWQFSTESYGKRASLIEERAIITAEAAGVKSRSHTAKILDGGSSVQVAFASEMRSL